MKKNIIILLLVFITLYFIYLSINLQSEIDEYKQTHIDEDSRCEMLQAIEYEFNYVQEALLEHNESEEELIKKFEQALIQRSGALARIYLHEDLKSRIIPVNGIGMSDRQVKQFNIISKKVIDKKSSQYEIEVLMVSGESVVITLTVSELDNKFNKRKHYIITELDGSIPSYID